MTNHRVVETPVANLVAGMKWFQNTFTRRMNCRHRLWGRLFGDRYKAIVVESDHEEIYLGRLIDYVHLNPARTGIVNPACGQSLLAYRWSSLSQAYAMMPAARPPWIETCTGFALSGLIDSTAGRRAMVERLEERIRADTANQGRAIQPKEPTLQARLESGWYWGS